MASKNKKPDAQQASGTVDDRGTTPVIANMQSP